MAQPGLLIGGLHNVDYKGAMRLVPSCVIFSIIVLCCAWDAPGIVAYGDIGLSNALVSAGEDVGRQLCFVLLLLATVASDVRASSMDFLLFVTRIFFSISGWLWLSLTWAPDPANAFRQLTSTAVTILGGAYAVELMTYRQVLRLQIAALVSISVLDWLAVALFPLVILQAAEQDQSVVGYWCGIHNYNNEASALCAITLIIFVHEARRVQSTLNGPALIVLIVLTSALLYETHSKTLGGFAFLAPLIGVAAHIAYNNPALRRVSAFLAIGLYLVDIAVVSNLLKPAASFFDDPAALTGRVQIWPVLLQYASSHLWLGAGSGYFWSVGEASPIYQYASGWVNTVNHAENGYIQIFIQTGAIGSAIVLATLIVHPFQRLLLKQLPVHRSRFLICAILAFGCLYDLLERSIVDRGMSTWVIVLIMYCLLNKELARVNAPFAAGAVFR